MIPSHPSSTALASGRTCQPACHGRHGGLEENSTLFCSSGAIVAWLELSMASYCAGNSGHHQMSSLLQTHGGSLDAFKVSALTWGGREGGRREEAPSNIFFLEHSNNIIFYPAFNSLPAYALNPWECSHPMWHVPFYGMWHHDVWDSIWEDQQHGAVWEEDVCVVLWRWSIHSNWATCSIAVWQLLIFMPCLGKNGSIA